MSPPSRTGVKPRRWSRRWIAGLGASFIATMVGLTIYDSVVAYRATHDEAWRVLDAQARVVAEQTARSLQAIDVVLRILVSEYESGALARMSDEALYQHLGKHTAGLVQAEGIAVYGHNGVLRVYSKMPPAAMPALDASANPQFRAVQDAMSSELIISNAMPGKVIGRWVFPISRPLRTASGAFDGAVTALGRVDYFQNFYGSTYPDSGTRVSLLRLDASILARYPPNNDTLGKPLPAGGELVKAAQSGRTLGRRISPVDGIDRFGAVRVVPDYPLVVVVAREARFVFAQWRPLAMRLAVRTAALASLAALLLYLTLRQLARLDKARDSLEVSQERYTLAAAGSDDGLWDWDLAAGVGHESARARELQALGQRPDAQPEPLSVLDALATYVEEDAERRRAAMNAHLQGASEAFEGDYRVRHGDGSVRWVHVRGLCIRNADGVPVRIAGSVSDIDARKRALEALHQSEERYQLAVRGANEGMWDWDLVGDRLFMSARAQEVVIGEASGEPLRQRSAWNAMTTYHPDDTQAVREAIAHHLQGRTAFFTVEFRVGHASGWRWCRQRGCGLRDAGGRVYRMAGSLEDITDRKQAEAEKERLQDQLRQAQKLEAIGTLAGGIAHDFNNILAAILGFSDLARQDAAEGSRQRAHIDSALAAGSRAKSLVERILAFSRTGMGERVPVHVQSVVAEALDSIGATLPPGVRLERRLDAGDAGVMGDPTQIHQVVMNLCANAVQAITAPGVVGVEATVVELKASLAVATSTLAPGLYVRLAISDTGSGIPPQLLQRIFDPFFTTKEVGVGTGLGLSLVHGIVTDLAGGIAVDSAIGRGSVFTVYLSANHVAARPTTPVAPQHAPLGDGQTILLVDDETALVELGEEALAALGYEPVAFASSIDALAAFTADPARFDLIVSDEAMPGMTGCELASAVRTLRADIPIILTSGFVTPAVLAAAREAGVDKVLGKPVGRADMARHLATFLGAAKRRSTTA